MYVWKAITTIYAMNVSIISEYSLPLSLFTIIVIRILIKFKLYNIVLLTIGTILCSGSLGLIHRNDFFKEQMRSCHAHLKNYSGLCIVLRKKCKFLAMALNTLLELIFACLSCFILGHSPIDFLNTRLVVLLTAPGSQLCLLFCLELFAQKSAV